MPKLNNATQTIRITRGTLSELTPAEHTYGQLSQLLHITDTNEVYIHDGTEFVPIITNRTPSSATDTGVKGQVAYDTNYIYVCVNSNVWKRVSISTW
jgi:hypothetical protein